MTGRGRDVGQARRSVAVTGPLTFLTVSSNCTRSPTRATRGAVLTTLSWATPNGFTGGGSGGVGDGVGGIGGIGGSGGTGGSILRVAVGADDRAARR